MNSEHPLVILKNFNDKQSKQIRTVSIHATSDCRSYGKAQFSYLNVKNECSWKYYNPVVYVKLDQDDKPEKWYFSERGSGVELKTTSVFKRVWSEKFETYYVVADHEEIYDNFEEDDAGEKCVTEIFNYEDFSAVITAPKSRTSKEEPPVYVRDSLNELFRFWLRTIIRANEQSDDHFPITEDIDTYNSVKAELSKLLQNKNLSEGERYDQIKAMVVNFDLISASVRADMFP